MLEEACHFYILQLTRAVTKSQLVLVLLAFKMALVKITTDQTASKELGSKIEHSKDLSSFCHIPWKFVIYNLKKIL